MRTALTLAVVVILALSLGCEGRMIQFQIPSGYVGWVEVEYGNPACPPAPRENGWLVLISGSDGRGCVRDSPGGSWLRMKYRYDDPLHTELVAEREIRREGYKIEDRNGHEAGRAFVFFVGKESDIKSGGLPHRQ